MRRAIIGAVLLGVILLASSLAFSQRGGEERGHGVLSVLSKGQAVNIKEVGGRYEIGIIANVEPLGYKVIEVGRDFVVVKDIVGVTELHIPIYSIKAVSILKTGGQNLSQ